MLDWADRALMSVVAEPIRLEFDLSDTQLGFLMGFAFVGFRALIGIPVGRLADLRNRRNLLALALAVWSSMTLAMGLARNFLESIIARLGVGAGTAGSYPPTLSMIADLFPLQKRGLAMGVWNVGGTVGFSLGVGVGGAIAGTAGWRAAMIYFGLLGIAVSIFLLFIVKEPIRRDSFGNELSSSTPPGLGEVLSFVRRQRSLVHITAGFVILTIVAQSIDFWTVSFLVRSHNIGLLEAGSLIAVVWLISGVPGTLFGGYLVDRLARRDIRWHTWMITAVCLISVIPAPFIYLSPTLPMALSAVFVFMLIWSMWFAPQTTLLTGLVGNRARAVAWAGFSVALLVVGQGLGPQITGIVSDLLEPHFGIHSLRYAMLTGVGFQVWAAVHFFLAARTLEEDYERAGNH
jgi:MFS family permease